MSLTVEREPKIDLLRICVWPPFLVSFKIWPDWGGVGRPNLQTLVFNYPDWRQDVILRFEQFKDDQPVIDVIDACCPAIILARLLILVPGEGQSPHFVSHCSGTFSADRNSVVDPTVLKKIKSEKAKGILVVPDWPTQPRYPRFKSMLIEEPIVFKPDANMLLSSDSQTHPLRATDYPGCREAIRRAFTEKGTPPEAVTLVLSSISLSTQKQYEFALKKWWQFCTLTLTYPLKASINNVLCFLSKEFDRGASYGSLSSYRSAIALILGPEVVRDCKVKRWFSKKPSV